VIYRDLSATVGRTPMVTLQRLAKGLPGRVVAKLEMRNPCGSVKDRLGVALIDDAERRGVLRPGTTLVEPTGGNTGIGLAFAAAIRGYRLVLTMPETMSTERVALLRQLGADVVLTPGILMGEAVARARQLIEEDPGAVMLDQFSNPATTRRAVSMSSCRRWAPGGPSPASVRCSRRRSPRSGSSPWNLRVRRCSRAGPPGTTASRASASGSFRRC
jgi:cysteine synthase